MLEKRIRAVVEGGVLEMEFYYHLRVFRLWSFNSCGMRVGGGDWPSQGFRVGVDDGVVRA